MFKGLVQATHTRWKDKNGTASRSNSRAPTRAGCHPPCFGSTCRLESHEAPSKKLALEAAHLKDLHASLPVKI